MTQDPLSPAGIVVSQAERDPLPEIRGPRRDPSGDGNLVLLPTPRAHARPAVAAEAPAAHDGRRRDYDADLLA